MTTNTTNSQAASIADDKEFQKLLNAVIQHQDNTSAALISGHIKYTNLMNYIDAKLAQARKEAALDREAHLMNSHMELMDAASAKHRIEKAEADAAMWAQRYADAVDAGSRAESRLAEIQRGVEGLTRYEFRTGFKLNVPTAGMLPEVLGNYVMFEAVEALLQLQGQADISGLPG